MGHHTTNPAIKIRHAAADDVDFILSLAPRFVSFELPRGRRKRATQTAIRADIGRALQELRRGEHFFLAIDADAKQIGFLHLRIHRDFFSGERACHVSDVAVASMHEGRGVGRALLAYAETWAKAHRCKLMTLSVFPDNSRARALYDRAGFNTDLVRMTKPLKP